LVIEAGVDCFSKLLPRGSSRPFTGLVVVRVISVEFMIFFFFFKFGVVPPRIEPFSFGDGDDSLEAGSPASVKCFVTTGDLPMSIRWSFHGQSVSSERGITTAGVGKRLSVLMVDSVAEHHVGNYTCTASNSAGHHEFTARLLVNGQSPKSNRNYNSFFFFSLTGSFRMKPQWRHLSTSKVI
jgi:hypothetical protein